MRSLKLPNLLDTRLGRLVAFFFLYVTEGIPLGFGAVAIATQLRRQDVGPAEIGAFVGAFYLPWAFKWAFGPFVDVFVSERLGRRRGWILGTQVGLVATLLACVPLDPVTQLGLLSVVLLVHNSFGAMQDVAIDALAVETLATDERGLANGVMFAGAALGMALGGAGVLFMMGWIGVPGGFLFVAGCITAVTVFIVLPLREAPTPAADRRAAGWAAATAEMRRFAVDAFRAFLGSRGAFAGLGFALLPAGAMALGLALQSNLAVELGLDDDSVAWLNLWSQVISAGCMVLGGWLSDRYGRRRTLAVYMTLMSLPVLWLAWQLQLNDWVMPVDTAARATRVVPPVLVTALWIATLAYSVGQGLMYGTRSAIFMDVTNAKVAATQFTAYMAMMNLVISYSATWQGIAAEAIGYPKTLLIDGLTGLLCLALLPLIRPALGPERDGAAARRARALATVLALGCLAWLPYRLQWWSAGAAAPMMETLFTLVFVASAVFLGAAALMPDATTVTRRIGGTMAVLLLAMHLRKWFPAFDPAYLTVPLVAAGLLLWQARQPWHTLQVAPAG
ncbi:MAG: MFS transporter [Burkholderiaceae bacterium]|nr:MFS transporter [Burkholderiaceae bacterium]